VVPAIRFWVSPVLGDRWARCGWDCHSRSWKLERQGALVELDRNPPERVVLVNRLRMRSTRKEAWAETLTLHDPGVVAEFLILCELTHAPRLIRAVRQVLVVPALAHERAKAEQWDASEGRPA